MKPGLPLIALEIFLGFGVPVAWALWELYALRRDRIARERAQADAARPEPDAGTVEARRRGS